MHFFSVSLMCSAVLLLQFQRATASLLPASCSKLLTTLNNRSDSLLDAYQTEICSKGCQPSVSDWDQWTYKNVFLPTVDALTTQTGMSSKIRDTFVKMGDEVATVVKKDCRQLLHGKHFCAEAGALEGWGKCFKRGFVGVAVRNGLRLLPVVMDEEVCRRELAFFERKELWEVVLPGYMREYAATCRKEDL